jgi:hypothetical protein
MSHDIVDECTSAEPLIIPGLSIPRAFLQNACKVSCCGVSCDKQSLAGDLSF